MVSVSTETIIVVSKLLLPARVSCIDISFWRTINAWYIVRYFLCHVAFFCISILHIRNDKQKCMKCVALWHCDTMIRQFSWLQWRQNLRALDGFGLRCWSDKLLTGASVVPSQAHLKETMPQKHTFKIASTLFSVCRSSLTSLSFTWQYTYFSKVRFR